MNVILISTVGYIQILKHFYIRILSNPSDSIKKHELDCCFKTKILYLKQVERVAQQTDDVLKESDSFKLQVFMSIYQELPG